MRDIERIESKYRMGEAEALKIKSNLRLFISEDPHNGGPEGYRVRSVYFDTPADTSFEDKVNGVDKRRKIRLRIYDPMDTTVYLEVKEKERMTNRKRVVTLSREQAVRMLCGDYDFLIDGYEYHSKAEKVFLPALAREMILGIYRPKVLVEYRRFAFATEDCETRITFDSDLRANEGNMNLLSPYVETYPAYPFGQVTMEVKYSEFLLSYLKAALGTHCRRMEADSKYILARKVSKYGRK